MTTPLSILVVDDQPDLVRSVRRILKLDGYRVESAGSVAELMDRDDWDSYFAILLDRKLPDGTADEVLPRLRAKTESAAVIVVTAYADLEGALAALHHGAEDFMLKPVDPEQLRNRLKRLADLRRAQFELVRERAFAQLILDTAQALILVLDADGRIQQVNRHLENLSGYAKAELLARDVIAALSPDDYVDEAHEHLSASYDGAYEQGRSHPMRTKSGDTYEVAWWNAPLRDEHGQVAQLVCAGLDRTHVNQLQNKLIQSERLAAIGEAMTGLAHESRNALQRSQACLDLLAEQLVDRPESLELLESAQRAQDNLHQLYEEVRAFAAPIQLNLGRHDLEALIRAAWKDVSTVHPDHQAELTLHTKRAEMTCKCDAFAVQKVFRNIFENAFQACPDELRMLVQGVDNASDTDRIRLRFLDNGPGIHPQQVSRIFHSFFTTKTEGTGLGMAIAQRIVQAHGGQIDVNPDCREGAEFILVLPRSL